MRFVSFLIFSFFIIFSCVKKKREIKDMNTQEPDFSKMIRKSDSARRHAILHKAFDTVQKKSKQTS